MIKRLIWGTVFILLSTSGAFSQQYFFRNYSVREGLPQSSLRCIIEDSRKYIWMGTEGAGVVRFDGNIFRTFTTADGLCDNIVYSLMEDHEGNIWIGTSNGISFYDGAEFRAIGKEQGLTGSGVMKIFESSDGSVWAATNNPDIGLLRLMPGDSLSLVNYSIKDGLVNYFVSDIYEDEKGRLWLAMAGGVNIVEFDRAAPAEIKKITSLEFPMVPDSTLILSIEPGVKGSVWLGSYGNGLFRATELPDTDRYIVEPSAINEASPGLSVWDMIQDKSGELWLATESKGVMRVLNDSVFRIYSTENGMQSNQILDIMVDHEGSYWFASFDRGAIMFNDEKFLAYTDPAILQGKQVLSLLADAGNTLYAGTEEGLVRFTNENGKLIKTDIYNIKNGLNDAGVNVLIKREEDLWIGTNRGINILRGKNLIKADINDDLPDQKVNCLLSDSHNIIWIGTNGGYGRLSGGNLSFITQDDGLIHNEVQTIIEDSKGRIWMGTIGGLVRILGDTYTDFNEQEGLSYLRINCLAEDPGGNIWIGTFQGGIFRYSDENDTLPISQIASRGVLSSNNITTILFADDSTAIAGTDKGFDLLRLDKEQKIIRVVHYGMNDGFTGENNPNSIAPDDFGCVWFGTKNGLVRFEPKVDIDYRFPVQASINDVRLFGRSIDWKEKRFKITKWSNLPDELVLAHNENHLTFDFTGLSYINPDDLQFSYCLERKQKNEWLPFSNNRSAQFPDLAPGNYTFKVRARNKFGVTGDATVYNFRIRPPFWRTKVFLSSLIVVLLLLVVLITRYRERKLVKEKEKLEETVRDRTKEVVEQKNEIERQRDILTLQKKEIDESMRAAETIQKAVLPEESLLQKYFAGYFVLFRPRDIVSGDFYWVSEKDGRIIVTVADCTGHGVPGALMSMLGISYLRKIVNEAGISQPDLILNNLRENIVLSLKQKDDLGASKDGMDISICCIDPVRMQLQFAGANNPLVMIRKDESGYKATEIRADKMPVAFHSRMEPFTNHIIDIQKGDSFYMFSDGYNDQFGGPHGRKFLKHQFVKMLLDNQHLDMKSQGQLYNATLDEWISFPSIESHSIGQIDDIIVLGIKIQ